MLYNLGMFIRTKTTANSPRKSVQVVQNYRVGDKVKQKIIRYLGIALNDREEAELRRMGEVFIKECKESLQPSLNFETSEQSASVSGDIVEHAEQDLPEQYLVNLPDCRNKETIVEGFSDIFKKLFEEYGLARIFGTTKSGISKTNTLLATVVGRFARPSSKLSTSAWLKQNIGISVSEDRIYRMMDNLHGKISKVQEIVSTKTMLLFGNKITIMLYDVTTLYFESFEEDELRKNGFSKDNKFKETQIVLGLATTTEGLPLWYEVFDGKTCEGKTLIETLEKFAMLVDPSEIVVVADRGMFSKINIEELESKGFKYVIGAKLRNMAVSQKAEILKIDSYQEINDSLKTKIFEDFGKSSSDEKTGKTLVVAWSAKRAAKDASDRQRLIDRAQKLIGKTGKIKADKLFTNSGTKKYLTKVDKSAAEYQINQDKIENESQWDGIFGVITNIKNIQNVAIRDNENSDKSIDTATILDYYKSLWRIEESFRLSKHDLEFRPVYHHKKERIKSHIAICYMSYALARLLEYKLKVQQKGTILSLAKIREALLDVQSTIIYDTKTSRHYKLPKDISPDAKKIYTTMGVKRDLVPTRILSLPLLKQKFFF
jgi:transposase